MKGANLYMNKDNKLERVIVHARMRPFTEEEIKNDNTTPIESFDTTKNLIVVRKDYDKKFFNYDSVFPPSANQDEVYEKSAKLIVESVLNGYNGTVFAYGQTGTGKTYTMAGDLDSEDKRGIIPCAFDHIFQEIRRNTDYKYQVRISFVQIYLETLQDLLEPSHENIRIREDPEHGVYLEGVEWIKVVNEIECRNVFSIGEKNRVTASTKMNSHSSRSHAILIVKLEKSKTITIEDVKSIAQESRDKLKSERLMTKSMLFLVDLAGSERVKKTKAESMRLEEAKKINYSLLVLGNCIQSLTDPKSSHVSYRDSKLTRLLQESLGGNAKTSLIVTISPSTSNVDETVSSLMFGQRAMKVQNKPVINKTVDYEALCIKLQEDLDRLNDEYAVLKVDYDRIFDTSRRVKHSKHNTDADIKINYKSDTNDSYIRVNKIDTELEESDASISDSAIEEVKEKCAEEMKKLEDYYEEVLKAKITEHDKFLGEIDIVMLKKDSLLDHLKKEIISLSEKNHSFDVHRQEISRVCQEEKILLEKKTNEFNQLKITNDCLMKEIKIEKTKNEKVKINKEIQTEKEILEKEECKCIYDKKISEIAFELSLLDSEDEKLDKNKIENIITYLYQDLQTKNKLLEEKSSHFFKFLSNQNNKEMESSKHFEDIKKSNNELLTKFESLQIEYSTIIEKLKKEEESNKNFLNEQEKFISQIQILKKEISSHKQSKILLDEKISNCMREEKKYKAKFNQVKEKIETLEKEKKDLRNLDTKNDLEGKIKKINRLEDELKNSYVQIQSYANSEKFLKSSFNESENILNKIFFKMRSHYENLANLNKEIKNIEKKKEIQNFALENLNNISTLSIYDENFLNLFDSIENSKNKITLPSDKEFNRFSHPKSKSPIKNFESVSELGSNKKNKSEINTNIFYEKCNDITNISMKIYSLYENFINFLVKILKKNFTLKNNILTNGVNQKLLDENQNLNQDLLQSAKTNKEENFVKEYILIFLKKIIKIEIFSDDEFKNIFVDYDAILNSKKWKNISLKEFERIYQEMLDEILKRISIFSSGKDIEIENLNERVIFLLRELEIFKKFEKSKKVQNENSSQNSNMDNLIKLKNEENENLRSRIEEHTTMIIELRHQINSRSNDNSIILSTSNISGEQKDLNSKENLMKRFLICDEDAHETKREILTDELYKISKDNTDNLDNLHNIDNGSYNLKKCKTKNTQEKHQKN